MVVRVLFDKIDPMSLAQFNGQAVEEPRIVSIGRDEIVFHGGVQKALLSGPALHVALAHIWTTTPMAHDAIVEIVQLLDHLF